MTEPSTVSALPDGFFTTSELIDIMNCAAERGISPRQLVHDSVMEDLAR